MDMAACTMAGPPVTRFRRTLGWASTALAFSWEGGSMVAMRPAGPPAARIAASRTRMVSRLQRTDAGWGAKITLLPAARMDRALLMTVEVGLVDGVTAPTIPNGANSTRVSPSSPVKAPARRHSVPGVRVAARRFFFTLSSARPMPVSSAAMRARGSAFSMAARRMASRIFSRALRPRSWNSAAVADSRSENTTEPAGAPALEPPVALCPPGIDPTPPPFSTRCRTSATILAISSLSTTPSVDPYPFSGKPLSLLFSKTSLPPRST